MLKGSSEHEVFEEVYNQKIKQSDIFTPKQAAEYGVFRIEENAKEADLTLGGSIKDTVVAAITKETSAYVSAVVPVVNPVCVEKEIRTTLRSGIPFLAYLDLISEMDGTEVLVDYKISAKKWSLSRANNDLQFQIYRMITEIDDVQVHNIVESVKPVTFNKEAMDSDDVVEVASNIRVINVEPESRVSDEHLNNLIEGVAKAISAGIFPPCSLDSWKCTEKFCSHYHECRGKK
jgi:hypothetical protein